MAERVGLELLLWPSKTNYFPNFCPLSSPFIKGDTTYNRIKGDINGASPSHIGSV